jgi:hypothetical protein
MKRKLMWLTAIGAVVALAYAQSSVIVRGAYGFGLASSSNAERPDAQFNFSVRQVEFNGQTRTSGFFAIETRSPVEVVHIHIPEVRQISVDMANKEAQFSGPAIAVRRTRTGIERARGTAIVRVHDRRNPREAEGDPDTIAVAFFTAQSSEPSYSYRGGVRRGDIVVFELSSSR